MSAILTAILPIIINLLEDVPSIVTDVETLISLVTSSTPLSSDQQATIDAALAAAHAKLQGTDTASAV